MTPHRCALIVQKDIAEESGDKDRVVAAAYCLELYERPLEEWELERCYGLDGWLNAAGRHEPVGSGLYGIPSPLDWLIMNHGPLRGRLLMTSTPAHANDTLLRQAIEGS
jgi:hypothetical protein